MKILLKDTLSEDLNTDPNLRTVAQDLLYMDRSPPKTYGSGLDFQRLPGFPNVMSG